MTSSTTLRLLLLMALLAVVGSCTQITNVFRDDSPRQTYAKKLQNSSLAQTPMVQEWQTAADTALVSPAFIAIPFQSRIVYFRDVPDARAFRFELSEGRQVHVRKVGSDTTQRVFIDLYEPGRNGGQPSRLASMRDSVLTYTADRSGNYILHVQPELLVTGAFTLQITDNPSMEFPVQDGRRSDIGSIWGDPRDGGSRRHEGVDIFAARGTPALAAADGRVTRTGNRGLGGKQVWLRAAGRSLYYAHLDSIKARMGQGVAVGDTLGFVGNTGNARSTPPHLHFGIYDRGAINPLPFIDGARTTLPAVTANLSSITTWARVASAEANVRRNGSTQEPPIASLRRGDAVRVTGATGDWFQVLLPGGQAGFIYRTLLEPADQRLGQTASDRMVTFYAQPNSPKALDTVAPPGPIAYYGRHGDRRLAKLQNHWVWIN